MIKLKQGDFVDTKGLTKDERLYVIRAFVNAGAPTLTYCATVQDHADIIVSRYVGWSKASGFVDGWDNYFHTGGVNEVDVDELLAHIHSKDSEKVVKCNRNVVFLDYDTVNGAGSLEITVTDDQEFNACFKGVGCVDSVEMNLDKEDFIELLKSWRKVINGAIEELED